MIIFSRLIKDSVKNLYTQRNPTYNLYVSLKNPGYMCIVYCRQSKLTHLNCEKARMRNLLQIAVE